MLASPADIYFDLYKVLNTWLKNKLKIVPGQFSYAVLVHENI